MKFSYNTNYYPPAPNLEIRLGLPDESLKVGPLPALVDTGADFTIVPVEIIEPLEVQIDDRKYLLNVGVEDLRLPLVEIIADELGDEVILGRNVINKLIMILNGREQTLEILE